MQAEAYAPDVRGALTATLNFARDRTDGGVWSNFDPVRASIRKGGHNPAQRWWCCPEVDPEQVLVFKGFDVDPAQPMGGLHSAFDHPAPLTGAPVSESIENRVLAFFA